MVGPTPTPGEEWLPLAAAQEGLLFAHQLAPDNPCCTTAEVVELVGPIDAGALRTAHERAYAEFEQVRVELALTPEGPRQRVGPAPAVPLPVVDVADDAAAQAWLDADVAVPFTLIGDQATDRAAAGLVRSALLRLPDGRCWWYHAAHHVIADGFGAQQLLRRIAAHHDAVLLGEVASAEEIASLAEVVAEDRARDDTAALAAWDARLADLSTPAGAVALAGRQAAPAARALREVAVLDEEVQAAIVRGARRLGVAWPDLVTAAIGAYLARMAGLPATRIGLPLMNRALPGVGQLAAARTVCTAMNVLPVTVPADGSLADTLRATSEEQRAIRAHPFLRQERLQRSLARSRPGTQLFGAQLNVIPFDLELALGGVRGTIRNLTAGPVEDMTIGLRGAPGRGRAVRLEIDAHPQLYDAGEISAHAARLTAWLVTVAGADPDSRIADLPLVTPTERAVLEGFNRTAREHVPHTLGRRFVDLARLMPDAPALIHGEQTRTYGELLTRARQIAAGLRARGVGVGDVVGVALPRGLGLYETVHAVQLLGAVYLPLDPDLPAQRTAMMLEDAEVRVVVDDPDALVEPVDPQDTSVHDDPSGAAYLLFTSGSTGRPKGVQVGHAAIDNRLAWMQRHFDLRPGERVLHKTPISFDVSVWELFWPLQVGGCVVIADPGAHRDPRQLADLVVDGGVDVLHFVPSMLRAFLADRVSRERVRGAQVRAVVCSGEALTPDLVDGCVRWFGVTPTNLYGPTEAAVDVTVWECAADDTGPVPIGRPIDNTTCHVLDPAGRPVPIGVVGELWLGGVQLADCYVGRPDLTAERFVELDLPGGRRRLYRTGDLVAWRTDGALRYLGRTDDQVKVRGQRIELGEIEAVVAGTEGVAAVAAGVVDGRLVVWFVPDDGVDDRTGAERLRRRAAEHLPDSWLPSHVLPVDQMPLGASGKTDRARLARIAPLTLTDADAEAPGSLLEERLCVLFGEVLGVDRVGPEADFFAHGGDSLGVLRLLARIDDDLGSEVGLATVFEAPTPAGLAAALTSGGPVTTGLEPVLTLRRARGTDRAPLFLLPPAGGLGWCYAGLLRSLPTDQEVHALQVPGIDGGTPVLDADLVALAARQLAVIRERVGRGRFHVAGWSLGGMAAHAVAALARSEGQDVGAVLLIDAYPSDQWQHLATPTEEEALRGILRLGGVEGLLPEGTPIDREVVAQTLRAGGSALAELPPEVLTGCIASVVAASRLVRSSQHPVLDGDVDVVVATAPRAETWLDATGWSSYTKGEVRAHPVAAAHGDLVRSPGVEVVGATLASLLQ
ncbi:hypothetical protein ASE01_08915 [Nocardioides sp. Root190]|uniref:non-ribosomal peptide synthetase n=1 Tax=Nocardioides sp. Root190 TaxID=1736488 RepID=UPI0006FBE4CE|nr:non-ribosomal peptide synthetase [Nocardioides sp. Root190]KRB76881.1 hypothetical protein ASE01_08915 [Nocardioides sp. Root190]